MSHEHIPSYALVRPHSDPDPDALARAAVAHVGDDFPAVGVFLCSGWMSS